MTFPVDENVSGRAGSSTGPGLPRGASSFQEAGVRVRWSGGGLPFQKPPLYPSPPVRPSGCLNSQTGTNSCEYHYHLPQAESQAKYALYSLNYGLIDAARFERRFGISLTDAYPDELEHATKHGLLIRQGRCWQVAPGRFDRMHLIRSLLYSAQAKQWMGSL